MRAILGLVGVAILAGGIWVTSTVPHRPAALTASTTARTSEPSGAADPAASRASRLEIVRLLRARNFVALTRAIETRQAQVERDIRQEAELATVVLSFDIADATATPLIDEWVAATPGSFAPRLGRAVHRVALAGASRGTRWASETSEEQFAGMETHLRGAVEDAQAVVAINPRVGEAYGVQIRAAMATGDQDDCAKAAGTGLLKLPASMRIRTALAICYLPRWGGSYRLIEELARESDRYLTQNPSLAALHGFVAWDQGNLAQNGSAEELERYNAAILAGENVLFYRDRARAQINRQHYVEALEDTTRALALRPEEPEVVMLRAQALCGLRRIEEAVAAVRLVEEIDAASSDLARFRVRELKQAAAEGYRLYSDGDERGAIARLTRGIELTGGNAEVHYWRGRTYLKLNDAERALADFEAAIRLDARHFESYRNVDYLLSLHRDWKGIVARWDKYIQVEPADGRGYLERGGARHHMGDETGALEDLTKACALGNKEGCNLVRRLSGK